MRTFIDSGVLITAWRGQPSPRIKALTIISDLRRVFISSPFVKLEVLPKPLWYSGHQEVNFYERFFSNVSEWVSNDNALAEEALQIGALYGLGGMDALHIAAAMRVQAEEFITAERTTSPLLRVRGLTIKTIA